MSAGLPGTPGSRVIAANNMLTVASHISRLWTSGVRRQ